MVKICVYQIISVNNKYFLFLWQTISFGFNYLFLIILFMFLLFDILTVFKQLCPPI